MDLPKGPSPTHRAGSTPAHTPNPPSSSGHGPRRRKNHRGGKKKKQRRKSFALPADEIAQDSANEEGLDEATPGFYTRPGRNLSTTSLESEALLDHRWDFSMIPRRHGDKLIT
jgi:magnesium transporter